MVHTQQTEPVKSQGRPQSVRRHLTEPSLRGDDGREVWIKLNWHHHLSLAFGKHFFAPVDNPTLVLDVYDKIGIWGLEMLKLYPDAQVTILDADPDHVIQKHFLKTKAAQQYLPFLSRLKGVTGAVNKPLPFSDARFDFTYVRLPDSFLSDVTWPQLIREMARVTKPDGYVEILCNGWMYTKRPSELIQRILDVQIQVCKAVGIAPTGSPGMEDYLRQVGVVDPYLRIHPLGKKGGQERKNLIKDLKQLFLDARVYAIKFGIQTAAEYDSDMEQFESEALRASIISPLKRVIFQPGRALRVAQAPDGLTEHIPESKTHG